MASFRAKNVGLLLALVGEGFEPAGVERVTHPTLKGREARRAFQRAWSAALAASQSAGLKPVYESRCSGDPQCGCKGYNAYPFGRVELDLSRVWSAW